MATRESTLATEGLAVAITGGMQRRMLARMRYRRRRDRKIAVDLIGRYFEIKYTPPLPNRAVEWIRIQLTRYNPDNHMIHFHVDSTIPKEISLSTDDFWSGYRTGIIRDAA